MAKELDLICTALETIATHVLNNWTSDALISEGTGQTWNTPAVSRHDLAFLASSLSKDLKSNEREYDKDELVYISDLPRRIAFLQAQTVPQLYNAGNAPLAVNTYINTLLFIRTRLLPIEFWHVVSDPKLMPASLARRVDSYRASLDKLAPDMSNLQQQVEQIQSAYTTSENLPIVLEELTKARGEVEKTSRDAISTAALIASNKDKSDSELVLIVDSRKQAAKLVENCEEAYQITTTKGLAAAFELRAKNLGYSMWAWVVGLIASLSLGAWIGGSHLTALSKSLEGNSVNWPIITIQIIISLVGIGAPLWFAWLSTKQIGQRFRLAEDYGFKASVAKAYEGYRKEAARIDPAFEAQLFSSALMRLDEAPLRLVETETHGSPWHEFANSEALQRAFKIAPEVQAQIISSLKEVIAATSAGAANIIKKDTKTPDQEST